VRHGKTIGAPIALRIENRDGQLGESPSVEDSPELAGHDKKLVAPRPGHADLAGSQKFDFPDARYISTCLGSRDGRRVAGASLAKLLLRQFDTESSVIHSSRHIQLDRKATCDEIVARERRSRFPVALCRFRHSDKMKPRSTPRSKRRHGGGIFEVIPVRSGRSRQSRAMGRKA